MAEVADEQYDRHPVIASLTFFPNLLDVGGIVHKGYPIRFLN